MDNLVIRQATLYDTKAVTSVLVESQWFTYKHLYSKSYIQNLVDQYYNEQRIKSEIMLISDKWSGYFLAEKAGKVIGVIGGGMINSTAGEIYVFYMDPNYRGLGVGTRLLNFFTKVQKHSYGATEQWVAVAKGNYYGIPFYEARGFIFQHEELAYGTTEDDQDISLKYKRQI
ncbi:GNAT family N-acetyltransferase [Sporosarcina sp. Marseille-Q4063]|uniref:GNAT family N-acetyltransferase n=1 Tax=Sporosarcina sp. Marseille-Q4063 TaxID=2810514 RepID=UPI001BB0BC9F|nr:N-acetyltransferase [Sporosarcina sp. Marseille-Q4063]QUW22766.1 GNAT family N-acetyltransferase [Sporosarcina sp. Marseille-Q4063]